MARVLTEVSKLTAEDDGSDMRPHVLIVDGLTTLLAPFSGVHGFGHRWRVTWTWRMLRQLATHTQVLVLSHSSSSSRNPRAYAREQALASSYSGAMTRFELSRDGPEGFMHGPQSIRLVLLNCEWGARGLDLVLRLD